MSEKCFCHLNGFAVKDATAREMCEEISTTLDEFVSSTVNDISNLNKFVNSKASEVQANVEAYVDSKIGSALEGEY